MFLIFIWSCIYIFVVNIYQHLAIIFSIFHKHASTFFNEHVSVVFKILLIIFIHLFNYLLVKDLNFERLARITIYLLTLLSSVFIVFSHYLTSPYSTCISVALQKLKDLSDDGVFQLSSCSRWGSYMLRTFCPKINPTYD